MFERIVLGFDGSGGARQALDRVAEMAPKCGSVVHVVAVGNLPDYAETTDEVDDLKDRAERFYKEKVKDAAAALASHGVHVQMHVEFGKPSETLVRVAEEVGADLIVLGTNPHSALHRRLIGATANKVLNRANCSVLVVR